MPRSALPAVRLLRGDAGFGYELPGTGPGTGRSVEVVAQELVSGVMDEVWHGGEKAVTRLTSERAEEWRAANDTHVSAADVAGWAAVLHAAPSPHPGSNPDHAAALAAPWLAHAELHTVFLAFCGEEQCDAEDAVEGGQRGEAWLSRVGFLHLCRECALMDVRMVTAMDLVFAAAIAAPARAGDGAGGDALGFAETVSGTPPFETALHFSSRVSADREPHHWALRLR